METADQLKNKLGEGVVVLASVEDSQESTGGRCRKSATGRIKAGI